MKYQTHDLTSRKYLLLPDGRRADSLRSKELLPLLRELGVQGLDSNLTQSQLCDQYQEQIFAPVLKKLPQHHGGPLPLSFQVAKQVAAVISKQAAGGFTSDPASKPPPLPIASTRV